jgi:hypothetical protein
MFRATCESDCNPLLPTRAHNRCENLGVSAFFDSFICRACLVFLKNSVNIVKQRIYVRFHTGVSRSPGPGERAWKTPVRDTLRRAQLVETSRTASLKTGSLPNPWRQVSVSLHHGLQYVASACPGNGVFTVTYVRTGIRKKAGSGLHVLNLKEMDKDANIRCGKNALRTASARTPALGLKIYIMDFYGTVLNSPLQRSRIPAEGKTYYGWDGWNTGLGKYG